jgi:hypothetical protein
MAQNNRQIALRFGIVHTESGSGVGKCAFNDPQRLVRRTRIWNLQNIHAHQRRRVIYPECNAEAPRRRDHPPGLRIKEGKQPVLVLVSSHPWLWRLVLLLLAVFILLLFGSTILRDTISLGLRFPLASREHRFNLVDIYIWQFRR